MAVGVEHRDDDQHDVAQLVERRGVVRRGQLVEQLVGGLRRADFRRVDAAADGDDDLVRGGDPARFLGRKRAWIGEPLVVGSDLIEIADVFGRRDDRGDRCGGRSVVGPRSTIFTRSEPAATSSKYFSIASHRREPYRRRRCESRSALRALELEPVAVAAPRDGEDEQEQTRE